MAKKDLLPQIIFKNKPRDEMIIGAYVEPLMYGKHQNSHDYKVSYEGAYDDIKACNINTVVQTCSLLNFEPNEITFDMLEKTSKRGLNFLMRDQNIILDKDEITSLSEDELVEYFNKTYKPLEEKYSSFVGLHFIDEPGYAMWPKIKNVQKAFRRACPDLLCYINLLQVYAPDWALSNGPIYLPDSPRWVAPDPDYVKYFESFINETEPDIFCYDYYPMRYEFPNMLGQYFEQLHLSYKNSKKANLPLACFVQTCTWDTGTRIPNEAEIRWQVNTALAYNTKAIFYYVYWTFPGHEGAPVALDGTKNRNYYRLQQINKELLFQDEYILNAEFKGYLQVGKMPNNEVPSLEDRLDSFASIKDLPDGNLFIGCFNYYKDDKVYDMYIIVNNDVSKGLSGRIQLDKVIKYTQIHKDQSVAINGDFIDLNLDAGDAYIIIENL